MLGEPVKSRALRDKNFSPGRPYHQGGAGLGEGIAYKCIESVENGKDRDEGRRAHRHAGYANPRDEVDDVVGLPGKQVAEGESERQRNHFFRSSSMCSA